MNEKGISLVQLRQRKTRQTAALFLAPVIILLVVFIAYPIIDTFITSGYQWNGISADKKMVGLANWAKLIKDTKFWIAFKNNVIIMILSIIIQIPLGLAMATFLDFGGKKLTIFKVIWFIPMLMSSVAIGFLFTYALATNGGIVSTISGWFGGGNIDLLGNPKLALLTVILIIAWQFTPFYMVYFMAGYTNIPYDVFEAARIDVTETKTRSVIDHYEEKSSYVDLGNGYFEEQTESVPVYTEETYTEDVEKPVYRKEPVYATKYYYEIDKWTVVDTAKSSGNDQNPSWPEPKLKDGQRTGAEEEHYFVTATYEKKKGKTETGRYEMDFSQWKELKKGEKIELKIDAAGFAEINQK